MYETLYRGIIVITTIVRWLVLYSSIAKCLVSPIKKNYQQIIKYT